LGGIECHNCIESLAELHLPLLTDLFMDTKMHGHQNNSVSGFKWSMPKLVSLYSKSYCDLGIPLSTPLKNLVVISEDFHRRALRPLPLLRFLSKPSLLYLESFNARFLKMWRFLYLRRRSRRKHGRRSRVFAALESTRRRSWSSPELSHGVPFSDAD
jgi:hypothetical protein